MLDRRIKLFRIRRKSFSNVLICPEDFRIAMAWPKDAWIVDCLYNTAHDTVDLYVQSEEYPRVADVGSAVPEQLGIVYLLSQSDLKQAAALIANKFGLIVAAL